MKTSTGYFLIGLGCLVYAAICKIGGNPDTQPMAMTALILFILSRVEALHEKK